MTETSSATADKQLHKREFLNKTTEATIRIALMIFIVGWCIRIISPFILPVVWGVIIATAVFPAYRWLSRTMGGRNRLAAVILTLVGLVVLIAPSLVSAGSLVRSAGWLVEGLRDGSLEVPLPPERIVDWPLIGEKLHAFWTLAHNNLVEALHQVGHRPRHLRLLR